MIVNLGVGLGSPPAAEGEGGDAEPDQGGGGMDVDGEGGLTEEDYGALALLDTVVEEREERLADEDVVQVLGIIRDALGGGAAGDGNGGESV